MEIRMGEYSGINSTPCPTNAVQTNEDSAVKVVAGVNGTLDSEAVAVIYEKSGRTESNTYSVDSVQAAIPEGALNSKMKTYLKDLGFYNGELGSEYTEEFKKALKCFQNAYFGAVIYSVNNKVLEKLQEKIESVGAAYYTNYTNNKLTDALKKLGFANPTTENKQNFARIQTFLEKGMGCNKYQTAGIMGNIMQESGFSPKAVNSKSGAFGIIQWNGIRKTYLNKYASKNGYSSADNMGIQFAYFRYEMSRTWRKGDIDENAPNSDLVKNWNTIKNEYKPSYYAVSDFFKDNIEGCNDNTYQIRRNYSSIIYQAIS
ncbi:MAG: phage tail tip lysozyme [Butyrivibrio sp.]|nr:phage tail tip lysozyme [Butyrivibrio sp.]